MRGDGASALGGAGQRRVCRSGGAAAGWWLGCWAAARLRGGGTSARRRCGSDQRRGSVGQYLCGEAVRLHRTARRGAFTSARELAIEASAVCCVCRDPEGLLHKHQASLSFFYFPKHFLTATTTKALFRYNQNLKTLQDSPSHRILWHLHGTLNIDKKDN